MNDYGIDLSGFYSFAGTDKYAYRIPGSNNSSPREHVEYYRCLKKIYIVDIVSRAISDEVQKKLAFNSYLSYHKADLKLSEWLTRSQVQKLFPSQCRFRSCITCYSQPHMIKQEPLYSPMTGDYIGRIKHFDTKKKIAEFRDKLLAFVEEEKKAREGRKMIIKKLKFLNITLEEAFNADFIAFFDLFKSVPYGTCECEHPGKTIIWHAYNCLKDEKQVEHFKNEMLRIIKIAIKNRLARQENAVIAAVNAYWNVIQTDGLVNGKNQADVLGHGWKEYINALNTQDEISNYYDHLTGLIDIEEDLELQNFSFDINNAPDIDKKEIVKKLEEEVNRAIREMKNSFYKKLLINSFNFWKEVIMHERNNYKLAKTCLLNNIIQIKEWDNDFSNCNNFDQNSSSNSFSSGANSYSEQTNNFSNSASQSNLNEEKNPNGSSFTSTNSDGVPQCGGDDHVPSTNTSSNTGSSSGTYYPSSGSSSVSSSPAPSSSPSPQETDKPKSLDTKERNNNPEPTPIHKENQDNNQDLKKQQVIKEIQTKLKELPVDLKTLVSGKYQNWEAEINKLTTIEQITAYQNALLQTIEQTKQEQMKQNSFDSSRQSQSTVPWIVGGVFFGE